jgi:hypothetical protein
MTRLSILSSRATASLLLWRGELDEPEEESDQLNFEEVDYDQGRRCIWPYRVSMGNWTFKA